MKGKLFKKVVASVSAVSMLASMAFAIPASAAEIYKQDYEGVTDASTVMKSQSAQGLVSIGTDKTNYLQFVGDNNTNSRSSYSDFNVDLSDKDEYIVEFEAALTTGNRDNSQFIIRSGNIPAANTYYDSKQGYILRLEGSATTTTWTINDVSSSTVSLTGGTWYKYKLYVNRTSGYVSITITPSEGGEAVIDKLIAPLSGDGSKITGLYWLNGRYNCAQKIDNIVVRDVEAGDEFGEVEEEALNKIEFTQQVNQVITQPEDAVHIPITVKASGTLGGDLTAVSKIEWSTTGLASDDGYVSLTKEEGTAPGTVGDAPGESDSTVYLNVRNGVSSYFGSVNVKVTYGDEVRELSTPFAILASATSSNIAPKAGYPDSMDDFKDDLVGYVGKASGITDQDLVLNNWSMYGSNGARYFNLSQDDDGTKYLRFSTNGGSGSAVAVYQLADQATQYIVDMKVRFTGGNMTFGHYFNTPNNTNNDPNWTASYGGGSLNVGTESITGLNQTDWYRIVVSADESAGTFWAKVYDNSGKLLGEQHDLALASTASAGQKYFCFQGTYPVDLNSFRIYYPTAAKLTVNGPETVQVPEAGAANTVEELSAVLTDADGNAMTGKINWSLDDDYAGVTLESTSQQGATLTVTDESGPATIIASASYGGITQEKEITLSTSGNAIAFTKSTASITIPFTGEDNVVAQFAAEARNRNAEKIEGVDVTYSMVDASGEPATVKGVTFDAATGTLTVEPGAASKIVYIKADATVDDEALTAKTKVNIHGLAFQFGSNEPTEEIYTQVTSADAYTDKIGYGFANTSVVTTNADNVSGTAEYMFKAKVPNGNYVINVGTTSGTIYSETVEKVTTAIARMPKGGSQFSVAVADGVLDLTFLADSTLSTLTITQATAKTKRDKPMLYAIGDSTTNNNGNGQASWGNVVSGGLATLPETFSGFANHGQAGRNSLSFYNQNRVENVLLDLCPGDYVTVNMGINTETGEPQAYYTLIDEYYVQAIMQRGGIPVILTATPQGPVGKAIGNYNASAPEGQQYNCARTNEAHNPDLRDIAAKHGLHVIELGAWGNDFFNSLRMSDVEAYNAAQGTSFTSVYEMVASWNPDWNHYTAYLATIYADYILGEVAKIANGEVPPPVIKHTVKFTAANATVTVDGTAVMSTEVEDGKDLSFTVTPAEGYIVKSVKVGTTELEAVDGVYTLTNVTADSTVVVATEKDIVEPTEYTVTFDTDVVDVNSPLDITVKSIVVEEGGSVSFRVVSRDGADLVKVLANGVELTDVDGVYTIENIMSDVDVTTDWKPVVAPSGWIKYEATYDADGVLTGITVTLDATPETVENTDTAKIFFWNDMMKPWIAE